MSKKSNVPISERRCRKWTFVHNNYTEENYQKICGLYPDQCEYLSVGREVAPSTGTPHLQGVIHFANAKKFSAINLILGFAVSHWEPQWADDDANARYTQKEGDSFVGGEPGKDKRSNLKKGDEWNEIKNQIKLGISWQELLEEYPRYAIQYGKSLRMYYEQLRPKTRKELEEMYPWQKQLTDLLTGEPHPRAIIWVYDEQGNTGKSAMADHLLSGGNWQVFSNGKTADVAHAWNGEHVIFDLARSQQDHINYEVMEQIKNGRIFSAKYESMTKIYARPHLVVFSNSMPDLTKMSQDRWHIYRIRGQYLERV